MMAHMGACVWGVCVLAYTCVSRRSTLGLVPKELFTLVFEAGFLIWPKAH